MTELKAFIAMLDRSGTGYGLRNDSNPAGTAVMVETGPSEQDFTITEFQFDAAGNLTEVESYPGETG